MTNTNAKFHKGQVVTLKATGEKVRILDLDSDPTASMWVTFEENPDRDAFVFADDASA